ncbi:MAG TPA: MATE family efflux transporter, partial [Draconibacterium sp.]|nr:MATE family efflux transporter [Draconibacterium sp.]
MNKSILKLTLPNIVSNITVPLLGLIDLALMGHLGSEVYIGAISLGSVIFNIIYWGFGFLRMSTSGFTAQAFGEKNSAEAITILIRALLLTLSVSIFI